MPIDPTLSQEILGLEARRIAAMVAKDAATLEAMLDDDLAYTHSHGRSDTKASFIDLVLHGENPYLGVTFTTAALVDLGSAVAVRGRAQIHLAASAAKPESSYPVLFSDVWTKRSGVWRLVGWHATRVHA